LEALARAAAKVGDAIYCFWQQRQNFDVFSAAQTIQQAGLRFQRGFACEKLSCPHMEFRRHASLYFFAPLNLPGSEKGHVNFIDIYILYFPRN